MKIINKMIILSVMIVSMAVEYGGVYISTELTAQGPEVGIEYCLSDWMDFSWNEGTKLRVGITAGLQDANGNACYGCMIARGIDLTDEASLWFVIKNLGGSGSGPMGIEYLHYISKENGVSLGIRVDCTTSGALSGVNHLWEVSITVKKMVINHEH